MPTVQLDDAKRRAWVAYVDGRLALRWVDHLHGGGIRTGTRFLTLPERFLWRLARKVPR